MQETHNISDTAWHMKRWMDKSEKRSIAMETRNSGGESYYHVIVTDNDALIAHQFPGATLVRVLYDDGTRAFSLDTREFLEWIHIVMNMFSEEEIPTRYAYE